MHPQRPEDNQAHAHMYKQKETKILHCILAKGKDMILPKFKYSDILVGFSLVPTEGKFFDNGKIKVLGIYYHLEFSSVANTRIWSSVILSVFFFFNRVLQKPAELCPR